MLYILHGDNIVASRGRLNQIRELAKDKEVREVNGKNCDLTSLTQSLTSNSLYGTETLIVIDNLISKLGRKTSLITQYAKIINGRSDDASIVLWEEKELSATSLKNFTGQVKAELYKLPVVLWQFLDTLKPGGAKNSLNLLRQILELEAPELVWSLITKRIVQLLYVCESVIPGDLQSWQAARLTSQAKAFTIEKLRQIHKGMLEAEYEFKSGRYVYMMREMIERAVYEF